MSEIDAYNEALRSGQYEKPTGLLGKYDNVRRFWEDQQVGLYLRPYLEELVVRRQKSGEKLRVLDLGCGSGDGFELLTGIKSSRAPASASERAVLQPGILGQYTGIDINEGLLDQARAIYGNRPEMSFVQSDVNTYEQAGEPPYDLYLANYGTLSHNNDGQTAELLANIARYAGNGAIIVIDWLGRFSYEWQTLWTRDFKNNPCMDYAISYIYSGDDDKRPELTYFPLRIMGRREALSIYNRANRKAEGVIKLRKLADRSSFVGRHIDTAQYNPHAQPLRRLVNSLFEPDVTTDLKELYINYVPAAGFDEINSYHRKLAYWWNYLVAYTQAGLEKSVSPAAQSPMPGSAGVALGVMIRVLKTADRIKAGSPRESLVEPQLAYCLRELEMGIQRGLGCGHGLVAIFEIEK